MDVGAYNSGPDGFAYVVVLASLRLELDCGRHFCVYAAAQMSRIDHHRMVATWSKRRGLVPAADRKFHDSTENIVGPVDVHRAFCWNSRGGFIRSVPRPRSQQIESRAK